MNLCILLNAQERLLVAKGVFTEAEYEDEINRSTAEMDQLGAEVRETMKTLRKRRRSG